MISPAHDLSLLKRQSCVCTPAHVFARVHPGTQDFVTRGTTYRASRQTWGCRKDVRVTLDMLAREQLSQGTLVSNLTCVGFSRDNFSWHQGSDQAKDRGRNMDCVVALSAFYTPWTNTQIGTSSAHDG